MSYSGTPSILRTFVALVAAAVRQGNDTEMTGTARNGLSRGACAYGVRVQDFIDPIYQDHPRNARQGFVLKHACNAPIRQAGAQGRRYAFGKSLSQWQVRSQRSGGNEDRYTRCADIIEPTARTGLGHMTQQARLAHARAAHHKDASPVTVENEVAGRG